MPPVRVCFRLSAGGTEAKPVGSHGIMCWPTRYSFLKTGQPSFFPKARRMPLQARAHCARIRNITQEPAHGDAFAVHLQRGKNKCQLKHSRGTYSTDERRLPTSPSAEALRELTAFSDEIRTLLLEPKVGLAFSIKKSGFLTYPRAFKQVLFRGMQQTSTPPNGSAGWFDVGIWRMGWVAGK